MRSPFFILLILSFVYAGCEKDSNATSSADAGSSNGSLTRFITVGQYLYIVDNSSLQTYSLQQPQTPQFKASTDVGFNIETIFSYQDKLFIGSNTALYIYSLSAPEKPARLAQVSYFIRGRDPAVARDSVAYSTLRGNFGGTLNVFNIKDPTQPFQVNALGLNSPHGLGLKDSALYVCNGASSLKVYNISKPFQPVEKYDLSSVNETFLDVIVQDKVLVCYIEGGICLLDISDIFKPVFISKIKN